MQPVIPIIKKILEYRQGGTVLDIGAGFGHHTLFLAEQGFEVTAIDTDADAIEKLTETANQMGLSVAAKIGDVRELTSLGGQWDIVICTFVLHFLQDEEVDRAVEVIKALTKPGGLNVIAAHTIENNDAEKARKPHLFEPNELKERYADWEILHYWQGLGKPFVGARTGQVAQKYRADLIAQKP